MVDWVSGLTGDEETTHPGDQRREHEELQMGTEHLALHPGAATRPPLTGPWRSSSFLLQMFPPPVSLLVIYPLLGWMRTQLNQHSLEAGERRAASNLRGETGSRDRELVLLNLLNPPRRSGRLSITTPSSTPNGFTAQPSLQ
ncbi:hypothetical protein NHX12_022811 [Muraenolepis orangiensis]|uniref:Uncharacterized protein n=1 Tax=Muraenolepis orangiensis TaxID=630683 RepID=A0A9Q0ITV5_9TELE|nr:hypothetical protein NHX12_022811 [Muraenolepis orangiensis]